MHRTLLLAIILVWTSSLFSQNADSQLETTPKLNVQLHTLQSVETQTKELSDSDIELEKLYDKDFLEQLKKESPSKYNYIISFFSQYEKLSPETKLINSKARLYHLFYAQKSEYEKVIKSTEKTTNN